MFRPGPIGLIDGRPRGYSGRLVELGLLHSQNFGKLAFEADESRQQGGWRSDQPAIGRFRVRRFGQMALVRKMLRVFARVEHQPPPSPIRDVSGTLCSAGKSS